MGHSQAVGSLLARRFEGPGGLAPQGVAAAVPEIPSVVSRVHDGRRMSPCGSHGGGEGLWVRESVVRLVAGTAAVFAIAAQGSIEEQILAESGSGLIVRVSVGCVRWWTDIKLVATQELDGCG